MKLSKPYALLCECFLGAASITGCTVEAGVGTVSPPPDITGSITVRWTIAGTAESALCAQYGADNLELIVYDQTDAPLFVTEAPCDAFSVSIDLDPDVYHADATLIDANQKARSLTLPIRDLRVTRATDLAVDIDFPVRSIL
jgi:hypothetical protein